jgi:integrase
MPSAQVISLAGQRQTPTSTLRRSVVSPGDTDYVFCTESGRPLHFRNLGKAFTKAADKAKLNTDEKRKLRFHDLRRTFASILIEGGCEGPYVAQQLGHSVAVLYSTYAGLLNARSQSEKGLAAIQKARGIKA